MTPKENLKIDKLSKRITWGMGIIFLVLLAYFPVINANSKKATEAYAKAEYVEGIVSTKLDAVLDKLDVYIETHQKETQDIKQDIENNRLNHAEVASKLLEKGYVKDLTFRSGKSN